MNYTNFERQVQLYWLWSTPVSSCGMFTDPMCWKYLCLLKAITNLLNCNSLVIQILLLSQNCLSFHIPSPPTHTSTPDRSNIIILLVLLCGLLIYWCSHHVQPNVVCNYDVASLWFMEMPSIKAQTSPFYVNIFCLSTAFFHVTTSWN